MCHLWPWVSLILARLAYWLCHAWSKHACRLAVSIRVSSSQTNLRMCHCYHLWIDVSWWSWQYLWRLNSSRFSIWSIEPMGSTHWPTSSGNYVMCLRPDLAVSSAGKRQHSTSRAVCSEHVKRVLAATVCHQKKEYRQVAAGQGYACKKQWCVQSAKLDSSYNILHQVHVMSFLTKVMQWWRIGASSADNQYIDCQQSIYQTKSKGENRITTHASLDWTNVTNNPQNAV